MEAVFFFTTESTEHTGICFLKITMKELANKVESNSFSYCLALEIAEAISLQLKNAEASHMILCGYQPGHCQAYPRHTAANDSV